MFMAEVTAIDLPAALSAASTARPWRAWRTSACRSTRPTSMNLAPCWAGSATALHPRTRFPPPIRRRRTFLRRPDGGADRGARVVLAADTEVRKICPGRQDVWPNGRLDPGAQADFRGCAIRSPNYVWEPSSTRSAPMDIRGVRSCHGGHELGRNQPSGKGRAYLLSLPAWVHGVICPPEGYWFVCLDWVAQEFGLGAGLSGDPAMIADFQSGDPHLGLAIRTGLAPEGATKASHGVIRKTIKPVSLGIPDRITEYGVARQTGKSRRWSREVLAAVRHKYRVYFEWQTGVVTKAVFDRRIVSSAGLPDGRASEHAATDAQELRASGRRGGHAEAFCRDWRSRWRRRHRAGSR